MSIPTPSLQVFPLQTSLFHENDDLFQFIINHVPKALIREEMILAITSKIVALSEGAIVKKNASLSPEAARAEKVALIKMEADQYLGEVKHSVHLTLKHGFLIPSSGIDESNAEGAYYILLPKDPYASANTLCEKLKGHYKLQKLGIIFTDSKTSPLRMGVTGVGLSHAGFKALKNQVGEPDLFGRVMKMTQINYLDALASSAVLMMGETTECCPLAVLYSKSVEFTDQKSEIDEIGIDPKSDLYPLPKI